MGVEAGRGARRRRVRFFAGGHRKVRIGWHKPRITSSLGLRYFTFNGADHASHAEQNAAIRYIRWRNARAQPKRHFAINSQIRRTPDVDHYHANVS